jgi:cystathionine beta-lyase/cystathionine gamma-synthase
MKKRALGPSTRAIHGVPHALTAGMPVSSPIVQSSTFVNPVGSHDHVLYTRYGNNPNQVTIAQRLAALEGAEAAIFLASGMGATSLALLAVLHPGDHLLASAWIYGGTRTLFDTEFHRMGIAVTYVDPAARGGWTKAIRKNTRAVFLETPTNPLARVLDLEPIAAVCRRHKLALLVDSSFASPYNYRALDHGADVVIHSATKYLNGHSDVIAGAVVGSAAVVDEVTRLLRVWGQAIDPHCAWLVERGMKTLAVRMERHNASGLTFARWAAKQPGVTAVQYPGLEDHPDHAIAKRTLIGFGGMVGLVVKGGAKGAERVLSRLTMVTHAPSFGGVESLVSEPRLTSHAALTPAERTAQGIPDGFIRVSLGLEDVDDIIHDFDQALSGS